MEKIYQTDNNDKQPSFFQQFFSDKSSIIVTLCIAAFIIVFLVGFGFNRISFAADDINAIPDKFVSSQATSDVEGSTPSVVEKLTIKPYYGILDATTGAKAPVYSINFSGLYEIGKEYNLAGKIDDQGLLYLLANLYPNKKFLNTDGNEYPEEVQMWISQAAVWTYLYNIGDSNHTGFADNAGIATGATSITMGEAEFTSAAAFFETNGINRLLTEARNYRDAVLDPLTVNKSSNEIAITNDGVYYQTGLISVVGTTKPSFYDSFESYSVSFEGAAEGAMLVDESGNKYENIDNMAPTAKFYIRVPVEKVTNENKKFSIKVTGKFKGAVGSIYKSTGMQDLATVNITTVPIEKNLSINLDYTPAIPGTKMDTARTLIFVGIFILLSGVGIIYAAKPRRN